MAQVGDLEAAAATTQATLATLTSGYASLTSEVATLKQDKAALVLQAITAPLVVHGEREPLPNCDANTNPGQQLTALWDDGNSSEVCVCTVSPGGHGRWSTVASETKTALKIGSGNTEAHGGMPGGRHHLMCDVSALHTNVYIRRPTILVGHPTAGQVPEAYVGASITFSSQTFETQGCVLKTQEYLNFAPVQHAKLALNNPIPKEGYKQALEISRGVLAPGKYQIDVPFPTDARVTIAGHVEIVGVSAGGGAVPVGLSFTVVDGGVLTTSGIYGFNRLSTDSGGEARIGISNPTPQNDLLQSLIFKGVSGGRTVLQPGKYQIDAPVDIKSTWSIEEDGDVSLVGSVSGAGSFKGAKWTITNGQLIATSVEFGGPAGGIEVIVSALQQGYAKFTKCHFNTFASGSPMIKTTCQPHCSHDTMMKGGRSVDVDVEDSTFDGIVAYPVYVAAPGTVTLKNCNVRNFRQPLTAYAGGVASTKRDTVKLVINGGNISNFFGQSGQGALFADYGHISISGVTFANNNPQNCAISSGTIVGTGC